MASVIACCVRWGERIGVGGTEIFSVRVTAYWGQEEGEGEAKSELWIYVCVHNTSQGSEGGCRAPLLEECLQHHGHKGDPGVTPGTCGAIGERAQVILVWVRAPGRWERLPPTETTSHEG